MEFTTSTGIKLTTDHPEAKSLNEYVKSLGLENVIVFYASTNQYVIYDGTHPVFESQSMESVAVHLDFMNLDGLFQTSETEG